MLSTAPVHPTLPTTNIERAREFYTKKLGLKELKRPMGEKAAVFEAGEKTLLYVYERPPSPAAHTLASFEVSDVEKTVRELQKVGIRFEEYNLPNLKTVNGIAMMGPEKVAWFKDPDGNILAIGTRAK